MIDGEEPFGLGYYLPRGFLRDSPKRLKSADYIVIHRPKGNLEQLKSELKKYSDAPLIVTDVKLRGIHPPLNVEGTKVGLLSAIANPLSFERTAGEIGFKIIDHLSYPDHEGFPLEKLQRFSDYCQTLGAEALLCTEKDWVRWERPPALSLPLHTLEIDLRVIEGDKTLERLIEQLEEVYATLG
jgi:tetraacyldisaccharide 4'-kinase